jgi:stress-induced morphogen
MITKETLSNYIRKSLPDAEVTVTDKTGMMDHFIVRVVSAQFEGKSLLDRNRLVYQALSEPMQDGRIHAVEIKAEAPAGSSQSAK